MAEKVGRREIYPPVPPPSVSKTKQLTTLANGKHPKHPTPVGKTNSRFASASRRLHTCVRTRGYSFTSLKCLLKS